MRAFLAVNFPEALQLHIVAATKAMRDAAPDARWVHEPLIHLTIKFLGEVEASRLEDVRQALGAVTETHARMTIRLVGAGAFPNLRRPRVVWLGVEAEPRFELLHHELENAYAAIGFEIEGRAFRPHATLGRVREPLSSSASRRLAAAVEAVVFDEEHVITSVDLMESHLSGSTDRYRMLLTAPLREF